MKVNQDDLNYVEAKLVQQNALLASFFVGVSIVPILYSWYWVYHFKSDFSPLMMLFSGIIVGLVARFAGKGLSSQFATIAFIAHLLVAAGAFLLGISFEGSLRAFVLFGLYLLGAWSAIYLSRKEISSSKYKAYYQLTIATKHSSYKSLKNRWFISVPFLLLLGGISTYFTIQLVAVTHFIVVQETAYDAKKAEADKIESKNIDVTPYGLKKYSTKQALRYAYAYYSGKLVNHNGRYLGEFPTSKYKAQTILKYLVKERDDIRSKFILGVISDSAHDRKLIEIASNEGDQFAQFLTAVEFGCSYSENEAKKLLYGIYRLAKEESLEREIDRVLTDGFYKTCESGLTTFRYRYIEDY